MFDIFIPVFIASIFFVMKPGPHIMAMTSMAIDGRWKSMIIYWVAAASAGTISYLVFLKSFSLLPVGSGMVFIFIKAIAAMLFISMGLFGLQKASNINRQAALEKKEIITKQSFLQNMAAGATMSLSNPYNIMYIFAAIPAITGKSSFSIIEILIVRLGVMSADILILSCYCLPLLFIRNYLSDTVLIKIRYLSSFAMMGVGVYIFVTMLLSKDLSVSGLIS